MSAAYFQPRPSRGRQHPTARAIADALLVEPALLNLRTRRLIPDIRQRFHVGRCTARTAIAIARRNP